MTHPLNLREEKIVYDFDIMKIFYYRGDCTVQIYDIVPVKEVATGETAMAEHGVMYVLESFIRTARQQYGTMFTMIPEGK